MTIIPYFLKGTDPCTSIQFLKSILYIKNAINIIFILIPIGLIIMLTKDFLQNIMATDENEMKKNNQLAIKRIIYVVVLFLVPTIVKVALNTGKAIDERFDICYNVTAEMIEKQIEINKNECNKNGDFWNEKSLICEIKQNTSPITNNNNQNATTITKPSKDNTSTSTKELSQMENSKSYKKIHTIQKIKKDNCKKILSVEENGSISAAQGLCVTDKYIITSQSNPPSDNNSNIKIYNKKNKTLEKSFTYNFNHANGITCKDDTLYVVHMTGSKRKYSTVSISDIIKGKAKVKSHNFSKNISGIAYDKDNDMFYFGKGSRLFVADNKLKYKKTISKKTTGKPQDLGAYKGLILSVRYDNNVDIYRVSDKKYLGTIEFPGFSELESIAYYGNGKFAILEQGFHSYDYVYVTDKIKL